MDRRNLEPTDLAAFPVPILDLNDPRLDGLLNNEGAALDRFILNALGLRRGLRASGRRVSGF